MALVALVAGEGSPREGGQVRPGGGAQVVPQQALAASTCRALRGLAYLGMDQNLFGWIKIQF